MLALIDADIILFRAGMAAEKNCWFLSVNGEEPEQFHLKKEALARLDELLPGQYSRKEGEDYQLWSERYCEPVENALHNVKSMVNNIKAKLELTDFDIRMILSGNSNFRNDVAKTKPYKGNRDRAHRPTHEEAIRDYIISQWTTIVSENEEADDVMGYMQCANPDDTIICTIDKDLDMIPGNHYNFVKDERYETTADQGMSLFYKQLLTGDPTDNIAGLKGVGAVKADNLLHGLTLADQWANVVSEYMSRAGEDWLEYLTEMGQLLWIRREPDEMWEPGLIEEGYDPDALYTGDMYGTD